LLFSASDPPPHAIVITMPSTPHPALLVCVSVPCCPGGVEGRVESDPQNNPCGPWTGVLVLAFASSNHISGLRNCLGEVEGRAKSDPQNNPCGPWTVAPALAFASSNIIPGLRNCQGGVKGDGEERPPKRPLWALDRFPCSYFCLQQQHLGPSKLLGGGGV
jgi:hypothetical protein